MKKQFLLLAFFSLAIFAGTNTAWGQTTLTPGVTNPTGENQAIPGISCAANASALNPVPGVPFTYEMNNGTGATSLNWTWWATKDPAFITGEGVFNINNMLLSPATSPTGTALIATSSNYGQNNANGSAGGSSSVQITWSPEILAATEYQADPTDWATASPTNKTPTFVVAYSQGVAGCADNMEVFELAPMPNFTVDIASIDASGATNAWDYDDEEQCVDQIQSATYSGGEILFNYGTNTIYFEIAAANFVNSFVPVFNVTSGLEGNQTARIYLYKTYADATTDATNVSALWSTDITTGTPLRPNISFTGAGADVATGVSLFAKIVITNNQWESLTNNPFVLAVDAQDNVNTDGTATAASTWDLDDPVDCDGDDLNDSTEGGEDNATIIITPRPTLEMVPDSGTGTGTTGEPNTADPNNVIPETTP